MRHKKYHVHFEERTKADTMSETRALLSGRTGAGREPTV